MRIAIVDDESIFRRQIDETITSLYGKGEVSCFHYSDGKAIIDSFKTGFALDAVFLDIEMKGMDGMETSVCNCALRESRHCMWEMKLYLMCIAIN